MAILYFHSENSAIELDYVGIDLPDGIAMRAEAVATHGQMLLEENVETIWRGSPLRLWVTDEPGGAGKTLLSLSTSGTGAL